MANWYGTARTNAFRVKDEAAFRRDMADLAGLDVDHRDSETERDEGILEDRPVRRFVLFEPYGEGWPTPSRPVHGPAGDPIDEEEIDLFDLVASHLADGEVAVFQAAGAEKQRYVSAYSVAVNHEGERLTVDIDDIYEKIGNAGWPKPTPAAY